MDELRASTELTRVLIVEDDEEIARMIRDDLQNRKFVIRVANNVRGAEELLADEAFDAIILDLTLPDGSGLNIAARLRSAGNEVPIIMLTAKDTVAERIEGFKRGADDYLCKPFALEELRARLHSILRRSGSGTRYTLTYENVSLDLLRRSVTRGRMEATLSARESELLAYLMRHAEEVLPRERILDDVWGDETEADSNVVNVYINYLRNKLEQGDGARIIHTVRGTGYVLSFRDPEGVS